jgi:hypothetical protein
MYGSAIVCAALAIGAAPVPEFPANQAPAPRLVRPDLSLVVLEVMPKTYNPSRGFWDLPYRVVRIGFRNGRPLPAETVWEGPRSLVYSLWGTRLVGGRYWVTASGGVLDLRENRLLSGEHDGRDGQIEETHVRYWVKHDERESGEFTFEYATKTLTRVGADTQAWHVGIRRHYLFPPLSPSGSAVICHEGEDELVLHRAGKPAKSLGKGFTMKPRTFGGIDECFPLLWLDEERVLTQRADGKLVTLDLTGKVTDLLTIPGELKERRPYLRRDPNGEVVYSMDWTYYVIDVAKKSAEKSEWEGLGDGFEVSRSADEQKRWCLRYEGREIGKIETWPRCVRVAPGYLAFALPDERPDSQRRVTVWAAATEKWITFDFPAPYFTPILGWFK